MEKQHKDKYDKEAIITSMKLVADRTMAMDFIWDWPAGVAFYGIGRAFEVLKDECYLDYLRTWVDRYMKQGIPEFTVNAVSLGHTLITLFDASGDDRYAELAERMACFLSREALRFGDGVFQHTVSQHYNFPEQAWADTLFMVAFFLVRMGVKFNNPDYLADGLHQYYWHEEFLQDTNSNLYYHAWDNINQNNLSSIYWARANAWAAVTSAGALSLIDAFNPSFMNIHDSLRDQLAALVRLQSENGLWHTVLDDSGSYEEVSASAGILTGLLGYKRIHGQQIYDREIYSGLKGLLSNIAQDGRILNVSSGTAVMKSAEDYKLIPKKRIQGWGQGLALAALAEVLEVYSGDKG